MPVAKLSNSLAKLILDLDDQQKDAAEIAQMLNLKKVQVSTILAYYKSARVESATDLLVDDMLPLEASADISVHDATGSFAESESSTIARNKPPGEREPQETAPENHIYVGDDT